MNQKQLLSHTQPSIAIALIFHKMQSWMGWQEHILLLQSVGRPLDKPNWPSRMRHYNAISPEDAMAGQGWAGHKARASRRNGSRHLMLGRPAGHLLDRARSQRLRREWRGGQKLQRATLQVRFITISVFLPYTPCYAMWVPDVDSMCLGFNIAMGRRLYLSILHRTGSWSRNDILKQLSFE